MPRAPVVLALALLAMTGCGNGAEPGASAPDFGPAPTQDSREREIRRVTCPAGTANCEAATGRILFLESVDADGDGDLHLIIAGGSVTAPGMTVLDVSRDLRPKRDPRIGDLASGAGPVYRGSYGQRQIQVTELVIARR